MKADELTQFLNSYLEISSFKDYGPNGLQIEGQTSINKLAFAVSATVDSIQKSIEFGADALIVHHGLVWSFHGPRTITGPYAKRVIPLIKNDISLYAYHLPLDAHAQVGNAQVICELLNLSDLDYFGDHKGSPTGRKGVFQKPIKVFELKEKLQSILGHNVILSSPNEKQAIKNIGIITGGANGGWSEASAQGLDAYLTGEISEHDWHDAKEAGIHMFAGGHHATEKFGIQKLMELLKTKFNVEVKYIDSENPA